MTAAGSSFEEPTFSRDGLTLLARQTRASTPGRIYNLTRLVRFDWPSATPRMLTDAFDRSVGSFDVSSDNRFVVFAAEDSGFSQLFRVPLTGGTVSKLFEVHEGS